MTGSKFQVSSSNLESSEARIKRILGAWSLKVETWNPKPGAWNLEPGT